MTADTIRAALEAAHKARIANRWQRTRRMFQNGAQLEPVEDGLADTAVAIAAFLRALPKANVPYPPPYWSTGWSGGALHGGAHITAVAPDRLAAAVEEAGRHE